MGNFGIVLSNMREKENLLDHKPFCTNEINNTIDNREESPRNIHKSCIFRLLREASHNLYYMTQEKHRISTKVLSGPLPHLIFIFTIQLRPSFYYLDRPTSFFLFVTFVQYAHHKHFKTLRMSYVSATYS